MSPEFPAPVLIVEDFVGGAAAADLLQYAVAHETDFQQAKVALGHEGRVDESLRISRVNSAMDSTMPLLETAIRKTVDAALPTLGLVNVDSYFLETQLTWCGDGGFFGKHCDTLSGRLSRRVLTMVYYFHREPKAFTGGQLRLHELGASGSYQEIEPRFDRAVFFPSWFPHEVRPVQCNSGAFPDGRFAMSCWVHKVPIQRATNETQRD
jgi:Rps23 Pro-64 3,4-dihydroxylase Tpa1-like proline 4-hydroxylase